MGHPPLELVVELDGERNQHTTHLLRRSAEMTR
jgi:hypothetical protein